MNHSEYIRVSEDNKTAILMIHGIAGTPDHFRDLVPLIPEGWSVYNILLEGHGKEVRDFGAASMKKWKAQVAARLEEIREKHDRIIIVTHSMGGLFAILDPHQLHGFVWRAGPLLFAGAAAESICASCHRGQFAENCAWAGKRKRQRG